MNRRLAEYRREHGTARPRHARKLTQSVDGMWQVVQNERGDRDVDDVATNWQSDDVTNRHVATHPRQHAG